jgi:dolichol kinase
MFHAPLLPGGLPSLTRPFETVMLLPPPEDDSRLNAMKRKADEDRPSGTKGMTATEWRRRAWHASPGFLPFLLWLVPHRDPISPTLQGILVFLVLILAGHVFWRYQRIERPHDRERPWAVLGYALSVLAMLLLFPQHLELGLTVLAVLAFGDGSATWGGLTFGGPKLPWNPQKTWSGLAAFLAVGIPMASLIYWGETYFNPESLEHQRVAFSTALLCGGTAVGFAAIAESVPTRINDNIRVGLAAGLGVTIMHSLLLGL